MLHDGGSGLSEDRFRCSDCHHSLEPFLDVQAYTHVRFDLRHLVLLCLASFSTGEHSRIEVQYKTTRHHGKLFLC